ncbi:Peptidoglycan-N-acetylglucosamine deacetylase [Choanephora cucurbitarum]|uniref:Peptidoglycan-N-acetylglucosamine deacetylase n=1 Tax=Choanephora cucurbitarum TaxID=101091 RepID=A0A1C7NFN2_9FUNG|nr:Peptidoglycan-N-acetylglucosamine deacetylase [Choanephora cucurbitarum]
MRASALFLTLAYAATLVMGRPTHTTTAAESTATEVAKAGNTTTVEKFSHCNRPGVFALTFDDGPGPYSWALAKTLNEQGIKATFFLNGANAVDVLHANATTEEGSKSYLEVIKHYYDLGHEVASHTWQHKDLANMTEAQVQEQMNTQSDIIFKAIGKRVQLMRPPEGVTDAVSSKVLKDLGYYNILWDIDTNDWRKRGLTAEQTEVKNVIDKDVANVTMGHIALEHDIHEHTVTELVPWLVGYIKEKGYQFVTVSDCIGIPAYRNDTLSTNGTVADAADAVNNATHIDINLAL